MPRIPASIQEYALDHAEDNAVVTRFSNKHRFRTRYNDDGELVIRAQGSGLKPEGYWSKVGESTWDYYSPHNRPGNALKSLVGLPGMDDRSTDEELYIRCPEATALPLMDGKGPTCMGARKKSKGRTPSPEQVEAFRLRMAAVRAAKKTP